MGKVFLSFYGLLTNFYERESGFILFVGFEGFSGANWFE
jgi:hypothetical protein